MRVSDLTRPKPVDAIIDLGDGDSIAVVFDRNRVTPAWVAVAQRRDDEQDTLSLPKALADVLISWDVVNDDDTVFQPTPENLAVLSYPAQAELLTRILQAAVPSRAEGNDSSVPGSTPQSDSAPLPPTPQNGAVTSTSPTSSAAPSLT